MSKKIKKKISCFIHKHFGKRKTKNESSLKKTTHCDRNFGGLCNFPKM